MHLIFLFNSIDLDAILFVNVENKNPFLEIFQSQFKMKLEPEL